MFNETDGYKSERLVASGAVNGGGPVRKLVRIQAKGGAAAGLTEWYDDASAVAASKRGGLTCPITSWSTAGPLNQAVSKLWITLDANISEVIVTYQPAGNP